MKPESCGKIGIPRRSFLMSAVAGITLLVVLEARARAATMGRGTKSTAVIQT